MPTVEQLWLKALPPGTELVAGEEGIFNEIGWAVVLRPSPPGFDSLKGGELALMSTEVVALLGVPLPNLISSLAEHGAGAIGLVGRLTPEAGKEARVRGLPLFVLPSQTPLSALEADIMQMINEERGRLYQLERQLNQTLMPLALAGKEAAVIIDKLRALTGRAIGLVDAGFKPVLAITPEIAGALSRVRDGVLARLRHSGTSNVVGIDLTAKLACFLGPVTVGGEVEVYLVLVAPRRELEEADRLIVRSGILALEVERSRRLAIEETEDRFREDLVETLLGGDVSSVPTLMERAKRVGLDLLQEHVAMAVRTAGSPHSPEMVERKTLSLLKKAWCHFRGDTLVILYPATPSMTAANFRDLARDISQKLNAGLEGTVSLGVGRFYPGVEGIKQSFQEAEEALTLGGRLFGPGSATCFGDLGVYRLLFYLKPGGELNAFYTEYLGRLAEYDRKHGGELMRTLESRLRNNTLAETAKALNVHRNTLLYRLQRIQEISGLDLEDGETRLILHLALRAGEVIRVA